MALERHNYCHKARTTNYPAKQLPVTSGNHFNTCNRLPNERSFGRFHVIIFFLYKYMLLNVISRMESWFQYLKQIARRGSSEIVGRWIVKEGKEGNDVINTFIIIISIIIIIIIIIIILYIY